MHDEGRPPAKEAAPDVTAGDTLSIDDDADLIAFVRRCRLNRQKAARRLPPLENGVVDPWVGESR